MSDSADKGALAIDSAAVAAAAAHARRLRAVAWFGLPVLATVYYLILTSAIPVFTRLLLLETIYCTPIVLTVVWCIQARARSEGNERRFWGCLGAANFILLLCEFLLVFWVFALNPAGPPRVSWPFHILHAVAAASFIGSLLALSRFTSAPPVRRIRWSLDASVVVLVIAVVLLFAYVQPVMGPSAPVGHVMLGLGYALFAVLMAGGTLGNVVGFKVDAWRPWDKLFAVALVIYSVGSFLWPTWYQTAVDTSRNYERGVLDLVQFAGHWLLMAAAVYRLTEVRVWELKPLPPIDTARWRWATAVTPTIAFVGIPIAAVAAFDVFAQREWLVIYLVFFSGVTALALVRSVLISLENGVLSHQSQTDPLTGLANHRAFHERLEEENARARRYGAPLSVVLIDIDRFADINARLGHQGADQLLQEIGTLLRGRCAREWTVARLSGDDFALIAPEQNAMEASVRARRLLDLISIEVGGSPRSVTACAGIAAYPENGEDADAVLCTARAALRRAKNAGPDSLSVTSEP